MHLHLNARWPVKPLKIMMLKMITLSLSQCLCKQMLIQKTIQTFTKPFNLGTKMRDGLE